MIAFTRLQHTSWQIISTALILLNTLLFHLSVLGLILGLLFFWLNSKKLSDIFFTDIKPGLKNVLGFLIICSYIGIVYTIAYHVYKIDIYVFIFTLVTIAGVVEYLSRKLNVNHLFFSNFKFGIPSLKRLRRWILPTATVLLDIVLLVAMFRAASEGVLRSPWEVLSYKFWLVFGFSNVTLIATVLHKKSRKNVYLFVWHLFVISILAIIVYPLGYGYDSFIHQAVLEILQRTGTIEPRLLIYMGQYGLALFASDLFQYTVGSVNKIVSPLFFSLLWPTSVYYGLRYGFAWSSRASLLAILWSVFIGFGFAIMTTPQSIGFILLAFMVFLLSELNRKTIPLYFFWIISVFALITHPLGGVPMIMLCFFISLKRINVNVWIQKIIFVLMWLAAAVSLPLLLAIWQFTNGTAWGNIFTFEPWPLIDGIQSYWSQAYNFPLDIVYNIGGNRLWIYTILVLIGIILIIKDRKFTLFRNHLLLLGILAINFLTSKIFINFNLQILYQQNDYLNRILFLLAIATLPIFLTTIYYYFRQTLKNGPSQWQKLWLLSFTSLIFMLGTYFSFPVYDRYGNSKSFNVTRTDLETVRLIEENSSGSDYIVLANQMVGAAAINKFGFASYYNDNFYYSMPLGADNIYSEFLEMIEVDASREKALQAMDKAGVDRLYFVVNNYWHSAKQARSQANASADDSFAVGDGVNTVFIYYR